MLSIRNLFSVIVLASMCIMIAAGIFGERIYSEIAEGRENALKESYEQINAVNRLQFYFKQQVQEWKNILLRGKDHEYYHDYLNKFYESERNARKEIELVSVLLELEGDNKSAMLLADKFDYAHRQAGKRYRQAISIYNETAESPHEAADTYVRGVDRAPTKMLDQLLNTVSEHKDDHLMRLDREIERKGMYIVIFLVITSIAILSLLIWLVDRKISGPIAVAISASDRIASGDFEKMEQPASNINEVRSLSKSLELMRKNLLDMTSTLVAAEELEQAHSLNDHVISVSPIGIAIYDHSGQCIVANDAMAEMTGTTQEQVLAQNYHKIEVWKKSGLLEVAKVSIYTREKQRFEFEVVTTSGKLGYYDCLLAPFMLNDEWHLLLMLDDIADRKRVEQETERIFELSVDMVGMGNLDGFFVRINSSFNRLLGYEDKEFLAKPFIEFVHEDDVEKTLEALTRAVEGKNDLNIVNRYKCKDGSFIWVEWNVLAIAKENIFYAYGRDITEHKQVEDQLRREKDRAQNYLDIAGVMLVALNNKGEVTLINKKGCEVLGDGEDKIIGKNWFDNYLPERLRRTVKNVFNNLLKGETELVEFYENVLLTSKGDEKIIAWHNSVLYDIEGRIIGILSSGTDITDIKAAEVELYKHQYQLEELVEDRTKELRAAQEELVRKERLATLGQLTATVSHELRNPLGAMKPSLYIIEKKIDKNDERVQKAIERIDRNIDRCDNIIDELLDFTRIIRLVRQSIRIDEWLESVVDEQDIPKDIRVEKDLSLKDVELVVDSDRLRRAVINVVENACHAMENENHQIIDKKNACLRIKTVSNDERIEIVISDSGSGMPQDILGRIFEPLFSTRGFGVGLGMPTVKQIMEQHGGGIDIDSEEGKGTTVTLWLPVRVAEEEDDGVVA